MADANTSDDITLEAVAVFRAGERRNDPVAAAAFFKFLDWSEANKIDPAQARLFLQDKDAVTGYIDQVRSVLTTSGSDFNSTLSNARDELLSAIRSDTQQTLSIQQEMQSLLRRQTEVTTNLEAASTRTEKVSEELGRNVSKVLSNTSTRTAFILGMLVSTLTNLGTGYLFDRYWSVDAINRRHHPDDVPALTLPELLPPPPPEGSDLMRMFQQNNVYVFVPVPTPVPIPSPAVPHHGAKAVPKHPPSRHHC